MHLKSQCVHTVYGQKKTRRGKKEARQELSHGGQALQGCSRMLLPAACCFDCLLRFLCLIEQNVARPNLIYDSTRQTQGARERGRSRGAQTGQHEYFICSWGCTIKRAPEETPKKRLQLAFAFAVVNNLQSKLLIKLSNIIFMVSVMVSKPCALPSPHSPFFHSLSRLANSLVFYGGSLICCFGFTSC